MNDLYIIYTQF